MVASTTAQQLLSPCRPREPPQPGMTRGVHRSLRNVLTCGYGLCWTRLDPIGSRLVGQSRATNSPSGGQPLPWRRVVARRCRRLLGQANKVASPCSFGLAAAAASPDWSRCPLSRTAASARSHRTLTRARQRPIQRATRVISLPIHVAYRRSRGRTARDTHPPNLHACGRQQTR
jgi:hypothetical protein